VEVANAMPSRDDISAAYQSAIKGQVAAVTPSAAVPPPAGPAAHTPRNAPDELAGEGTRAKGLLAVGDIAAARQGRERAADAQEAEAALMLGTTYDPLVIGNQDMRSITPDPAMARQWYQKAAALGSADARRRLSELRN
jgi:TPR repeat protein